jgi:ectoine hydroxylase-related dioxygenase (phytanoyl-CoA dioxygenase family)
MRIIVLLLVVLEFCFHFISKSCLRGFQLSSTIINCCHCFNVFLPLQDTPHSMGPTEIRPASHYLTRGQSLARNILVAKCHKTLIPPVWPALYQGDVLIFDYRILHRGRANIRRLQNRNYLVFTYAQPWFCAVLNFPKHPSIYDK